MSEQLYENAGDPFGACFSENRFMQARYLRSAYGDPELSGCLFEAGGGRRERGVPNENQMHFCARLPAASEFACDVGDDTKSKSLTEALKIFASTAL